MVSNLKPSLRDRNRYLVFSVLSEKTADRKSVVDGIWSSLLRLHGEVGASKTGIWMMDWDDGTKTGIVKVNRGGVETLRSSMSLIKEINGGKAAVNVFHVSGTLKKAREAMQRS